MHTKIATLRDKGIAVSLFVEPSLTAVEAARQSGATAVELHVGEICIALQKKSASPPAILASAIAAAKAAHAAGLEVHIGHGIDYDVAPHFKLLPLVSEADIGMLSLPKRFLLVLRQRCGDERTACLLTYNGDFKGLVPYLH